MAEHKATELPTNWAEPMIEARKAVERASDAAEKGHIAEALAAIGTARGALMAAGERLDAAMVQGARNHVMDDAIDRARDPGKWAPR